MFLYLIVLTGMSLLVGVFRFVLLNNCLTSTIVDGEVCEKRERENEREPWILIDNDFHNLPLCC